jgi:hypothetical protein
MNRSKSISPVERAVIAQKWHKSAVTANIHALIGDDSDALVNSAGRILYVVLGASIAEGIGPEQLEIRIIRGAVGALYDQVDSPTIPKDRRSSIVRGLQAANELIPMLERKNLVDSACELAMKLRRGDVLMSDFCGLVAG